MTIRAALLAGLLAAPALADWQVDPAGSAIGFVTVKNTETAEPHGFGEVSGGVADNGAAEILIKLGSVDTGIEIRDARMREMLFRIAEHPVARVIAKIDMMALEDLAPNTRRMLETPIQVFANGAQADYDAMLILTRIGEDAVSVSTARPIPVHAADLGYDGGVEALREVAGLDAISPVVPVSVNLLLRR